MTTPAQSLEGRTNLPQPIPDGVASERTNYGSVAEKFHSRAMPEPNSGCWLWTGTYDREGYGRIYIASLQKYVRAHRLSMILHGRSIPDGMLVLHKCDNPTCVNPDHLWAGTNRENIEDRFVKGRSAVSDKIFLTKLTEADVMEIRRSYVPRSKLYGARALARKYGVGEGAIHNALSHRTWAHVGDRS